MLTLFRLSGKSSGKSNTNSLNSRYDHSFDCISCKVLPDVSEASQQLDVSVLHSLILEKTMGIDKENMAKQINLTYTKFFEEAIIKVDKGQFQCSFILNPTRVTEIRDVAAAGEKMPQKSTYFYPKMITGMVMNDIGVE